MGTLPHIAIAILNYNGRHFFDQFLPSVLLTEYPNFSVWVIDNASTDDSIAYLEQHYPQVKLVRNLHNGGFAEGYNEGLQSIDAPFLLLLNSDVEVAPNFLQPLVDCMLSNDKVAFVQPKICSYQQRHLFEYAGAGGGRIDQLGYPFCRGRLFDFVEEDAGQYNDESAIFWASGAAMLARRSAFEKLGGFYGYFFMHNEEIDLCWRAGNQGWKVQYNGKSVVYHLGGGSLQKENPRKTFFNFRNNLVMITRNMPLQWLLWVLPTRFFLDLVAAFKMIAGRQPDNAIAIIKAWIQFLGWLAVPAAGKWPGKRGWGYERNGVFAGSIVWQYFAKGKKSISA